MRKLFRFLTGLFALFGVLAAIGLVFLSVSVAAIVRGGGDAPDVPDRALLMLDLDVAPTEGPEGDPLTGLVLDDGRDIRALVETLDRAARDDRVVGLFVRIGAIDLRLAHAQELRDAVKAFRARGKSAFAFAESFDAKAAAPSAAYHLASGFDEIRMQPSGLVGLQGVALESPFAAEALRDLGIEAQFVKRREYKTAFDTFTEDGMTDANREMLEAVALSWLTQATAGLAEGRGLEIAEARALMDAGPYLAQDALDAGLVDALSYRAEAEGLAETAAGDGVETMSFGRYAAAAAADLDDDDGPAARVAVIRAVGAIMDGADGGPLDGGAIAGPDLAAEIRAAADDSDIDAILLRIDSPGGTYAGSDAIWNAVREARDSGMPVVASMASVAASGGYLAARAADAVIAQPGTLTGSIGVVGGKPALEALWDDLGIRWEAATAGDGADWLSVNRRFTDAEFAKFTRIIDALYRDFVDKAAESRGMDRDAMELIARGRVWTGADARRIGLVDELGGYDAARRILRERLEIDGDVRLDLVSWPEPGSPLEQLKDLVSGGGFAAASTGHADAARRLSRVLDLLAPVLDVADTPRTGAYDPDAARLAR